MVKLPAAATLAIVLIQAAMAQTPGGGSPAVIRVESQEVLVDVTVTGKQGMPVTGLAAKNFSVWEDGRQQKISGFSATATDPEASPKHFILYLDFSSLELNQQREMVDHAREFVKTMAGNDRFMAIVTMSRGGSSVEQNFTAVVSSLNKGLDAALATAALPLVAGRDYQLSTTPGGSNASQSVTSPAQRLAESLRAVAYSVTPETGRKTLLLFTGGYWLDGNGRDAINQAIVECNRANMAIYVVAGSPPPTQIGSYIRGPVDPLTPPGEAIRMLASGTGGGVVTTSSASLAQQLGEVAREQDESYRIGYVPPQSKEGSCHTIRVRADIPGDVKARGEYCTARAVDIVAGKIGGQSIESRAGAAAGASNAMMQLPWFYTGANRASVHLSLDLTPAGTKFRKAGGKMHGEIDLVGIASRADGGTAARFADSVAIDLDSQKQANDFVRRSWHYENQFPIVAGKLSFTLLVSGGEVAPVRLSAPLEVDAWNASQFAIGSIALCKQIFTADSASTAQDGPILEGRTPLVAGGKRFVPASTSRFRRLEPAYFYTEIYEPLLAGSAPPMLMLGYRIVERNTGGVKVDTGMAGIAGFVQPGNPIVPVGTTLHFGDLPLGAYRLEVRAAHSSGTEVVTRTVDFDLD